jgi:hypothetical protein
MYLLVLLNETGCMNVLTVCHHSNVISENNKAFDISIIILDYQLLNFLPPKANARQFLTNCENNISISNFHKQILRQPYNFSGFNSHCVISYQAMSPVPKSKKYKLLQRSHKVKRGNIKPYQRY